MNTQSMILINDHNDHGRVTIRGNVWASGDKCFTLDAYVYEDGEGTPLPVCKYYSLRVALSDADRILLGQVTEADQLTGELLRPLSDS